MDNRDIRNCPECGQQTASGRPYCGKCGIRIEKSCRECGNILFDNDAFCTACGSKTGGASGDCPNCNTPTRYRNQPFCTECGTMLIIQCASCGAPISPEWKYCSHCGRNFNSDKIDIRTAANIKQRFANVQDVDSSDSSPGEEHNTRGLRHFDDEDYETAIEEFRAAIDCDPDNSSYHCNLAVALDEMGEDDQAKKEYEIALKLDPDDTTALLYLGYMYSENSDVENAEKVWRHLIEIAPNTAESKEALEGLQHLSEI